jgi:hypothetical protein
MEEPEMEVAEATAGVPGRKEEASPTRQRSEFERSLIEKINMHKGKIVELLEQQGSSFPLRQLIDVIEFVAPLFDLLEPQGLSIYLTGLANA